MPDEFVLDACPALQRDPVDGEFDAATESFVFVDDEGDGDAGGSDLPGEPGGGLELGAPGGAGGNLLREDLGDPGLGEGVELCVQGDCRAVEARRTRESDVSDGLGAGDRGPGQLGSGRARFAYGRCRHSEHLRELGHEAEAGGVLLDGHLALAGPARRARRGGPG